MKKRLVDNDLLCQSIIRAAKRSIHVTIKYELKLNVSFALTSLNTNLE